MWRSVLSAPSPPADGRSGRTGATPVAHVVLHPLAEWRRVLHLRRTDASALAITRGAPGNQPGARSRRLADRSRAAWPARHGPGPAVGALPLHPARNCSPRWARATLQRPPANDRGGSALRRGRASRHTHLHSGQERTRLLPHDDVPRLRHQPRTRPLGVAEHHQRRIADRTAVHQPPAPRAPGVALRREPTTASFGPSPTSSSGRPRT